MTPAMVLFFLLPLPGESQFVVARPPPAPSLREGEADASQDEVGDDEPEELPPRDKKKAKVEVGGRVFVRDEFTKREDVAGKTGNWIGEKELASARISADYRQDDLRIQVEAELSGDPEVKDAFIGLTFDPGLDLRAGQFKMPFSAIEMESAWTLPVVRRGLLHDLLLDRLQLAGRRPGAQLETGPGGSADLRVTLGGWQGSGYDGDLVAGESDDAFAKNWAGRVSVEPGDVEVGVSVESRVAEPVFAQGLERFWAAELDVTWKGDAGGRIWAEVIAGESWLDDDVADDDDPIFTAGRLIAAWRLGPDGKGVPYIEPFLMVGGIDPDSSIESDLVYELCAGFNAGRWDRWRLQLQAEVRETDRNTPAGYSETTAILTDSSTVMLQLGAAF